MVKIDQLVGTWKLVSSEARDEYNHVRYPFGNDAIGYLIYTVDGYVSVSIMRANRQPYISSDVSGGTIAEKAVAAESYQTYFGTYEIQGHQLIHHIVLSLFPNWVGTDLVRDFTLTHDTLALRTKPFTVGGSMRTATLTWQRAK